MKRVLTALVMIPAVVGLIFYSPYWLIAAATAVVACLCFAEFLSIARAHGMLVSGPLGLAAGLVVLAAPSPQAPMLVAMLCAVLVASLTRADLKDVLLSNAGLIFGVVYVFGAWRCGLELFRIQPHLLLFAMAVNWVGDVAAYVVGSRFGRHKLAPRVSPAKSWEGFAGSLTLATVFGIFYLTRFVPDFRVPEAAGLAVLANVAGQLGDLAESAMKRGAGIKDSGGMLPGHGGWLDRVDSTLFSLPVVYVWWTR